MRIWKLAGILAFTLAATMLSGCLVVRHDHDSPRHVPPGHARVPPGHVKHHDHHHGPGCGHVFRDGRWVSVEIEIGR
jgi:hypothetical protein